MAMLPLVLFAQDAPWYDTPYTFNYSVPVSASVQNTPPQIALQWPPSSFTLSGNIHKLIYRRSPGNDWISVASLPHGAAGYTDTNVSVGQPYEYQVYDNESFGWGYIISGIEVPLIEFRGKVILIVDDTYASNLSSELAQLEMDLIGDGWSVIRHDVSRSDAPPNIKALIQADYNMDPDKVQAVLLLGHVPVPYSGWIAPDFHGDHRGAWPADVYYGDMNGTWTDTIDYTAQPVCQTPGQCSTDPRQINIPGDGKFDNSTVPGVVKLQVGRVDLANMPSFAPKTELDLLRQYLAKDHNYRHAQLNVGQRGFVDDSFSGWGWYFAGVGIRSFAPLVGFTNIDWITSGDYFGSLSSQSYFWSYGAGPGWFQGAGGIGQTSDFASRDPKAVFTMLFGSWFGDWDVPDNFLRAPLAATTYGLTCMWSSYSGGTSWYLHHMGLGETIGYGARLSQNNNQSLDFCETNGYCPGGGLFISMALMGDPTLRLYPIAPPSDLRLYPNQLCTKTVLGFVCTPAPGVASLLWLASPDGGVIGYNLYKTDPAHPSWTRVNQQLITGKLNTGTSYADTSNAGGNVDNTNYMLRAVKLQSSPSGTYYDASEGIFATTYSCGLPNSLWGCEPIPCACKPF